MGRTCPSSTSQRRQLLDDGNMTIRTPTDDGGSGTDDMQTLHDVSQRGVSNAGIRPFMGQQWNTSLQHNNWRLVLLFRFLYYSIACACPL